jgi:hypothetical protein
MATSKAPNARTAVPHTTILLKRFPRDLHREMKAEAARRGIYVSAAYAEACHMYLTRLAQRRRRQTP